MKCLLKILIITLTSLTIYSQTPSQTNLKNSSGIEPVYKFVPYETVFDQLVNLKPVSGNVARINNITLIRDQAIFNLKAGTLYLLSPVGNKTVAALLL